jgi:hypothetical protein
VKEIEFYAELKKLFMFLQEKSFFYFTANCKRLAKKEEKKNVIHFLRNNTWDIKYRDKTTF